MGREMGRVERKASSWKVGKLRTDDFEFILVCTADKNLLQIQCGCELNLSIAIDLVR